MKKILLVDDDSDFCFFAKANLEREAGFEVTVCNQSKEALRLVKILQPDIILLDMMMPEKGGITIASELGRNKYTAHIPYIFLSGIVNEQELKKHRQLIGDADFITKPVETSVLVSTIN